jgi:hypothetical protein
MGRSPGFASCYLRLIRPFKTRFRYGSAPEVLNLATDNNSPVHYAKGTPSPVIRPKTDHRAPTACRCMVSGPFNSPNRGSFHRSLALLSTIGRRVVLSLGGWSPQLHTEFHELRATLERQPDASTFAYRTITFCGRTFQIVPLIVAPVMSAPATPGSKPPGLGSSAFARRY